MNLQLTCTLCGQEVVEGEREAHRRNCPAPRYEIAQDLPPFSADATTAIIDAQSDNADVIVHIDPQMILSEQAREALARVVCEALNAASFEPSYEVA